MYRRSTLIALLGLGLFYGSPGNGNGQAKKSDLKQLEMDIKAAQGTGNARTLAIRRLSEYPAPVAAKQAQVAAILMKRVKDAKDYDAMRALAIWATAAEIKMIPEYLGNDNLTKAAIYALGKLKVGEQAKAIAPYLESRGGRDREALGALTEIGAASEDAVLPYLKKKGQPLVFAIQILTKVGGTKSLEPLRKLTEAKGQDRGVVADAKIAITRIESRLKSNQGK